ncbi:MAG: alpha amylase C-terminal domain-containing protein [Phycisphaerae bacterium]
MTLPPADHPIDGTGLIALDPWLEPYADALRRRYSRYLDTLKRIELSRRHEYLGLNRGLCDGKAGLWYREWAPAAEAVFLIGDFNGWDRTAHPLTRDDGGVWSIFLPDDDSMRQPAHGSHVKVHVVSAIGPKDRNPAYCRRAVQDPDTLIYCAQHWDPPQPHVFQQAVPRLTGGLRIYEAHVGMAMEEPRIGTYGEFADRIIPRIAAAGYNAVQLMAVQEHPYYASFGYHVSNFFAPSSRFGTPEDLKCLIDTAHGAGLAVFLDVIHSHSVKNVEDGLNLFDGTQEQYFHAGSRGQHPGWDSLLFDYGKIEVLGFLLSNLRYWLETFGFDGFRFDGVTSMMYHHHGLGGGFNSYDDYFEPHVDSDAVVYLQLANRLVHSINPQAITIAEDVSGMVGLARPLDEGGLGFDYRLAMGIPDYWIRLLSERRDQDWDMDDLYRALTNRRSGEKHVAYAESHDQALVGDKTLAFRLMDAAMYWHMDRSSQDPIIDRGMALHKMIRLITFTLGGEAYLNFMGNEFGHPEWVDFPRAQNDNSFHYARRQWSLLDNPDLRYGDLAAFDRAMQDLDRHHSLLNDPFIEPLDIDRNRKLIAFRRGPLVLVFNFHPDTSYTDHRIGVPDATDYRLMLNTDATPFGGAQHVANDHIYPCQDKPHHDRKQSIQMYLPARTAQVLAPVNPEG